MTASRGYAAAFRRSWKIILVAVVLGALGGMAATSTAEPQFTARSTVFLSGQASDRDATAAYQASMLSEQKAKTYAGLITSDRIVQDVAKDLGYTTTTDIEAVRGRLSATATTDTALITITAKGLSPEHARRLADAAAAALVRLVAELERPDDPPGSPALRARVVEAAQLPTAAVAPRPVTNVLFGVLLGLLLGGIAAVARSALDRTVRSTEDLRGTVDAPVLGSIVADSSVVRRPLVMLQAPESSVSESVRQVRNTVQFLDDQSHQLLVLTSARSGEGKTTLAGNLGIALGQAGQRVVLVDADLRSARLSDNFGLSRSPGLSDVLQGKHDLDAVVHQCRPDQVDVIASGYAPTEPSDLVASPVMAALMRRLADEYDYVIIDAPALSAANNAGALVANADGAILVVRHGRTPREDVENAVSTLRSLSGRVIGTVLTMAPASAPGHARVPVQAADATGRRGDTSVRTAPVGGHGSANGRASEGG